MAVGIQATDVNLTSGAEMPGVEPPFFAGFEAVGVVVQVGESYKNRVTIGQVKI